MDSNWIIRQATGDDIPYIYSTWTKSYRYDSSVGKDCQNSVFFPNYNRIIDEILDAEDTLTLVAANPDKDTVIYGYCVTQPHTLHYTFVKEAFRRLGIAKALYQEVFGPGFASTDITHRTNHAEPIIRLYPQLVYNPFVNYKQKESA